MLQIFKNLVALELQFAVPLKANRRHVGQL